MEWQEEAQLKEQWEVDGKMEEILEHNTSGRKCMASGKTKEGRQLRPLDGALALKFCIHRAIHLMQM